MSDPLRITCPCGYENWVPEEKRGQEFMCPMCGQELIAEDSEAAPLAQPEPSDESDQSGRSAKRAPSLDRPRNPFEADELETAVRPKFEYAPPTPAPAPPPKPRARSPFEADAEPEAPAAPDRGKLVAGPFSLELAPAPKPAPAPIDQLEKHRPKASRPRHTFIDTISPHDAPTGEKCSQCGRELRGTWDRIETAAGLLCYVCSNQATQGVPERLKAAPATERREVRESDLIQKSGPAEPVEYSRVSIDTKSDGFRRAILILACVTLVATLYVFFFSSGSTGGPASGAVAGAPTKIVDIPPWAKLAVNCYTILTLSLVVFLSLYIALAIDDSLPHESFGRNVVYLAAISVPLGFMHYLGIWSAGLIAPLYMAGAVYPPLIYLARNLISILLITHWLNVRFFTVAVFLILFGALNQLVSFASGTLLRLLFAV